ncbi:MAG: YfcE family phosphodiesterase [Betaproteobacteria bacterium RIFCSPLOWO2_12_FULL_65_14]|nr:MAG: YfcE family phosphodiesterase [Betaproteobacteria bacterium RIFCSPLOWO2_12_FULL_65_14]
MLSSSSALSVGLISDTHGLMRPEALTALAGSRYIVHAGDIGDPAVLEQLARIAPVTAVRGNNDAGQWASALRETEILEVGNTRIFVVHDVAALEGAPKGFDVVVAGHSHRPREERRDGVLFVNPGSAGPRRFKLPVAVARLQIAGKRVRFELLPL